MSQIVPGPEAGASPGKASGASQGSGALPTAGFWGVRSQLARKGDTPASLGMGVEGGVQGETQRLPGP